MLDYLCPSLVSDKIELFGGYDDLIRAPAADRNKGPILEVLQQCLTVDKGFVFEVASGPGQHVVYFAQHFPSVTFLPSDCDVSYLKRYGLLIPMRCECDSDISYMYIYISDVYASFVSLYFEFCEFENQ